MDELTQEEKHCLNNFCFGKIFKPSYKKVCDDMEAFIANKSKPAELRGAVFGWMAEYPEEYHHLMSYIVHLLKAIKEDFHDHDFAIPEGTRTKIYKIGCLIKKRGGFTAKQACFYVALNFLDPFDSRMKAIKICWGWD